MLLKHQLSLHPSFRLGQWEGDGGGETWLTNCPSWKLMLQWRTESWRCETSGPFGLCFWSILHPSQCHRGTANTVKLANGGPSGRRPDSKQDRIPDLKLFSSLVIWFAKSNSWNPVALCWELTVGQTDWNMNTSRITKLNVSVLTC